MANRWNAQRLSPLSLQRPHLSLQIESQAFQAGYTAALTQAVVSGIDVSQVDEQTIIQIILNVSEIYSEQWDNFDQMLRYWSGVIAGILTRQNVEVAE